MTLLLTLLWAGLKCLIGGILAGCGMIAGVSALIRLNEWWETRHGVRLPRKAPELGVHVAFDDPADAATAIATDPRFGARTFHPTREW